MKLGIIGSGRIAKRAITELAFVPEFVVASVYNPSYEHGEVFARWVTEQQSDSGKAEAAVQAALDLDEMAEQVDAVYIASPHATHYPYAKDLLESGKHILCEKPMAFSGYQVKELFAIAREKGLVLMEGLKTAYCPGFTKLQDVINTGVIGEVVDVEAAFTRLTQPGCREFDDRKYGGSFTEFGTYTMLPIFRFLGTDYKSVHFCSISADTGVDGYTKASFEYGGALATATTGLTAKHEGQLLISGTKGYILVPSPWWLTRYFEVRYEDPSHIEKYNCEFEADGLRYEFREFSSRINAIISGVPGASADRSLFSGQLFSMEEREALARAGVFEKFIGQRYD